MAKYNWNRDWVKFIIQFLGGCYYLLWVWGIILFLVFAIIVSPKRLTLRESLVIFTTVGYFAWDAHIIIGFMLDFLDFGPTKKVEFTDWALVSFVPPLIAILFLNLKKTDNYLLYALIWTVISFFLEWLLSRVGYMKHLEWKIWYSIPVYFLAYLLLPWYLKEGIKKI